VHIPTILYSAKRNDNIEAVIAFVNQKHSSTYKRPRNYLGLMQHIIWGVFKPYTAKIPPKLKNTSINLIFLIALCFRKI